MNGRPTKKSARRRQEGGRNRRPENPGGSEPDERWDVRRIAACICNLIGVFMARYDEAPLRLMPSIEIRRRARICKNVNLTSISR
jgi:hypothetical protein